jgi:hypothetical protein
MSLGVGANHERLTAAAPCDMLVARKYSSALTECRGRAMSVHVTLTPAQREQIIELGNKGAGGNFDPVIMSQLLTLGVVEISNSRRLVLTDAGKVAYRNLRKNAKRDD